jgi:hypothetical protein
MIKIPSALSSSVLKLRKRKKSPNPRNFHQKLSPHTQKISQGPKLFAIWGLSIHDSVKEPSSVYLQAAAKTGNSALNNPS